MKAIKVWNTQATQLNSANNALGNSILLIIKNIIIKIIFYFKCKVQYVINP